MGLYACVRARAWSDYVICRWDAHVWWNVARTYSLTLALTNTLTDELTQTQPAPWVGSIVRRGGFIYVTLPVVIWRFSLPKPVRELNYALHVLFLLPSLLLLFFKEEHLLCHVDAFKRRHTHYIPRQGEGPRRVFPWKSNCMHESERYLHRIDHPFADLRPIKAVTHLLIHTLAFSTAVTERHGHGLKLYLGQDEDDSIFIKWLENIRCYYNYPLGSKFFLWFL